MPALKRADARHLFNIRSLRCISRIRLRNRCMSDAGTPFGDRSNPLRYTYNSIIVVLLIDILAIFGTNLYKKLVNKETVFENRLSKEKEEIEKLKNQLR